MGIVAKVRFPVVMAAAEARVEGFCCSGRLGGSLSRQKAASNPQAAEGLFIVMPGHERAARRVDGGACCRRTGQGGLWRLRGPRGAPS